MDSKAAAVFSGLRALIEERNVLIGEIAERQARIKAINEEVKKEENGIKELQAMMRKPRKPRTKKEKNTEQGGDTPNEATESTIADQTTTETTQNQNEAQPTSSKRTKK